MLWGVADAGTQALIAEVIAFLEREVAGVISTAFDHYDSRAGDPQLHTHVVVSNKVLTVQD